MCARPDILDIGTLEFLRVEDVDGAHFDTTKIVDLVILVGGFLTCLGSQRPVVLVAGSIVFYRSATKYSKYDFCYSSSDSDSDSDELLVVGRI